LKQVFKHARQMLAVSVEKSRRRLSELLTDSELVAFYEAVWNARNANHLVMIKLLIYTGIRNAELTNIQIKDVDLTNCTIRIEQGKGKKDRYVLFQSHFVANWRNTLKIKSVKAEDFYLKLIVWERFRRVESARLLRNMLTTPALKSVSIRTFSAIRLLLT
jgi:integrase/recombinase XerD